MRSPRLKRARRTQAQPDADEARRWNLRRKIAALESENNALRRALREVVGWYDSFDLPGGGVNLDDDDFERFRLLARFAFSDAGKAAV